MPSVHRILDANANRAREALRVMEEAARFVLNDAELCGAIKSIRHELASALARVPALNANRDTPGDVGTSIKASGEGDRSSVADVVIAAGKRLSEALRAIEEYAKVLPDTFDSNDRDPRPLWAIVESLRYRGYDIEQRLNRELATGRARQWRLCVLITAELCRGGDWLRVARGCVEGGADCVQLREKAIESGELLRRASTLVALCRPRGVSVIINDRPDIALLAGADGVHLGQHDLPCTQARRLVGNQLLIGVSTSRLDEARRAKLDGADYCGVGPMFNTTTKHKDVIVGPAYLAEFVAWGGLPHLAIGGVTAERVPALLEAIAGRARAGDTAGVPAIGVAVSSAVCAADDPAAQARRLRAALDATGVTR